MKNVLKTSIVIALLAIFVSCSKNNDGNSVNNGEETQNGVVTGAIRYKAVDKGSNAENVWILSYDDRGEKARADFYGGGLHIIFLVINGEIWGYFPYLGWTSDMGSLLGMTGMDDMPKVNSVEEITQFGFTKTGTMTVLGKKCDKWEGEWEEGYMVIYGYWQALALYMEDAESTWTATKYSFKVPAKAFDKKTMEVDWV